jgi:hypothetical protein
MTLRSSLVFLLVFLVPGIALGEDAPRPQTETGIIIENKPAPASEAAKKGIIIENKPAPSR